MFFPLSVTVRGLLFVSLRFLCLLRNCLLETHTLILKALFLKQYTHIHRRKWRKHDSDRSTHISTEVTTEKNLYMAIRRDQLDGKLGTLILEQTR